MDLISYEVHPGRGLTGRIALNGAERDVMIGNIRLLQRGGIFTYPSLMCERSKSSKSASSVYISIDGQVAGQVSYTDSTIPGARSVVRELHSRGFKTHIMTGDSSSSANVVATDLGIDRSNVHASLLPHEKADLVHQLRSQHGHVVMVGDNANDVPALIASTFGIVVSEQHISRSDSSALPGECLSSSLRTEGDARLLPIDTRRPATCHIYFPEASDPHGFQRILYVLDLMQATTKRMHQALWGSLFYNAVALSLASGIVSAFAPAKVSTLLDLSPYVPLPFPCHLLFLPLIRTVKKSLVDRMR